MRLEMLGEFKIIVCFFVILHFHAVGGDTVASRSFIQRSLKVTGKQKFSPASYK